MSLQEVTPTMLSRNLQVMMKDAGVILPRVLTDFQVNLSMGKEVEIGGVGSVNIDTGTGSISYQDPNAFSQKVKIDSDPYFAINFKDKETAQSLAKILPFLRKGANALANKIDVDIAALADGAQKEVGGASTVVGASEIMRYMSEAYAYIRSNSSNNDMMDIDFFMGPYTSKVVQELAINKDTDNSSVLRNGYLGKLGGFNLFETTAVKSSGTYTDGGSYVEYNFMCISKKAIAAVLQANPDAEIIRRDAAFATGVRGMILKGQKLIEEKVFVAFPCKPDLSD